METALRNLVTAAMEALALDNAFKHAGYDSNPFFSLYGWIADAIYDLIGETEAFRDSVTARALSGGAMSVDDRVLLLLSTQ